MYTYSVELSASTENCPGEIGNKNAFSSRFSSEAEMEARHTFNVSGPSGTLPEAEVPSFKEAVNELNKDFKQLTTMLLTVRVFCVI